MKVFRMMATPTGGAFEKFKRSVLTGFPVSKLLNTMSTNDQKAFMNLANGQMYGAWALPLTRSGRNVRVWDAINAGDLAAFYVGDRFSHYAPIIFKYRSDNISAMARWGRPISGSYSLAFLVGTPIQCDLSVTDYCALMVYGGVPANSDYHDEAASAELLEALTTGIPVTDSCDPELELEGALLYRIQCFRERSEANRLRILEKRPASCEVCEFEFAKQYGPLFGVSTHVHHKNPLALGRRRAQSIDEFAVICAHCHTAVHKGKGRKLNPWTIEELRGFVQQKWDFQQ